MAATLLILLVLGVAALFAAVLFIRRSKRKARNRDSALRRKRNLAYQFSWNQIFGRKRLQRLTDQRENID